MVLTRGLVGFLNMLPNWKVRPHPLSFQTIEAGVVSWEWVVKSESGVVICTIPTIIRKAPVEIPKGRMTQRSTRIARSVAGRGSVLHTNAEVRNVSQIHLERVIQMIMGSGVSELPEV